MITRNIKILIQNCKTEKQSQASLCRRPKLVLDLVQASKYDKTKPRTQRMQCNSEISLLFLLSLFFMRLLAPFCLFSFVFFLIQNCSKIILMTSARNKRFAHVSNLNLTVQQHTQRILCRRETASNKLSQIYLCTSKYVSKTICSCAHIKNRSGLMQYKDQDFTQTRIDRSRHTNTRTHARD